MSGKFIRRKGFSSAEKRIAAFTLVELLVVVAIIALLVSILLPSLGRAKEQAKIVVCQTSLKGLGVGFTFYTNKHDQWYPASDGYGGDPPTWDYRMKDDYGNLEMLHCPSDNFDRQPWFDDGRIDYLEEQMYPGNEIEEAPRSYAMNISLSYRGPSKLGDDDGYAGGTRTPFTGIGMDMYKTTDLEIPAETVVLGDEWESMFWAPPQPGIHGDHKGSGMWNGMWTSTVYPPAPSRIETYYHSNHTKANFLFADSHVEILPEGHPYLSDINGNGTNDSGDFYYFKREK